MALRDTTTVSGRPLALQTGPADFTDAMYPFARSMSVDGCRIAYRDEGEGPAIVLLHGIPLSMTTWQAVYPALAQNHRVIAIDMPGYGRSAKTGGDYSLDAIAARILALCAELGVAKTHVVGSSFGAAVAMTMAFTDRGRIDRLVLVNSVGIAGGTHSIEKVVRSGLIRYLVAGALSRRRFGKPIFRAKLRNSYASMLPPEALVDHYYELLLRDGGERSFLKTLQQFRERDLQRRLPEVGNEVLSIWGGEDSVLPLRNAVNIQKRLANCWSRILPASGHLPHEEQPREFVAIVEKFLAMP